MSVSQKEIAEHLGVSQALVGMALNSHPRISAATRARVENAAKQLGYDRDLHSGARQMAAKRHGLRILNNVIAVCSNPDQHPVHQQPFESEILDGIESEAGKHNLDSLMCRLRSERLPRLIEKQEVDGAIMISSAVETLEAIKRLDFPIVKIGSSSPEMHSISAQNYAGTLLTTSHLVDLGHRRIAYIGRDFTTRPEISTLTDTARQRFEGYRAAMQKAALPVEYQCCFLTGNFPEDGARGFNEIWKQSAGNVTAVVCYNDTLAMGVIGAARQRGMEVPRDLSVVGFDAVSDRFTFEPFITSVGYDRVSMGKRAVEILLQYRQGKTAKNTFICEEVPVHFTDGATTAPPKNVP